MKEIQMSTVEMPVLCGCNFCAAYESFYHADRVLDFHVLIYVVTGTIYVTEVADEEENDYTVEAGELLFLKAGNRHFGKKECPKKTTWYYAHFRMPDREDTVLFEGENGEWMHFEPLLYHRTLAKKFTVAINGNITEMFKELVDYYYGADSYKRWYLNMKLFCLLSELALTPLKEEEKGNNAISDRIAQYLKNHLTTPFGAKELEQEFYLSYKYMAYVFKKEKQMPMQKYHTMLRMEEAGRMLRSTLLSVGEISERIGYKDMLYFSRCFHQYMGMSPTEYRKRFTTYY